MKINTETASNQFLSTFVMIEKLVEICEDDIWNKWIGIPITKRTKKIKINV